jgi:hypothetical protein
LNADWLLRYTCHSVATLLKLIGCHHLKFASKLKYLNSSEFVAPQILVNALACARRNCGATNQNLSPVFSREKFARYASLRSLCMGSCRPVAFGVIAPLVFRLGGIAWYRYLAEFLPVILVCSMLWLVKGARRCLSPAAVLTAFQRLTSRANCLQPPLRPKTSTN